jgi:hypothetical protein
MGGEKTRMAFGLSDEKERQAAGSGGREIRAKEKRRELRLLRARPLSGLQIEKMSGSHVGPADPVSPLRERAQLQIRREMRVLSLLTRQTIFSPE